jgi:hypothetical protein
MEYLWLSFQKQQSKSNAPCINWFSNKSLGTQLKHHVKRKLDRTFISNN